MKKLLLILLAIVTIISNVVVAESIIPSHEVKVAKVEKVDAIADMGLIGIGEILEVNRNKVEEVEVKDYVEVLARVTAYAPFDNQSGICADGNPSVTSVGHKPSSKYIAVDPDKIPYGTKVYIEGYGMTEAGDTGGALRSYNGYAIDVYFETYKEAIDWGKKYIMVRIYKEE